MSPILTASKARLGWSLILSLALYFLLPGYETGAQAFLFSSRPEGLGAASSAVQPVATKLLQPAEFNRPGDYGLRQAEVFPEAQDSTPTGTANTPTLTNTPSTTPAPSETRAPHRRLTRTPRPTSTPPTIPPSQDPGTTKTMIIFGGMVVMVILFGVWLNRKNAI